MATVTIEIGGRSYAVACRDGEEAHLQSLATIVDGKAGQAAAALGTMGENRHLLFTALLLADQMVEQGRGVVPEPPAPDPAVAEALERLADRLETLAGRLEGSGAGA